MSVGRMRHYPMPLYPSEDEIACAVMGERAKDWPHKARYLEDKFNLPRIDPLMGGRYWPAIEAFFRRRHGLDDFVDDAPNIVPTIRIVPFPEDSKDPSDGPQTQNYHDRRSIHRPGRSRT